MILSKTVIINLNPQAVIYYESLGYFIPKHYDKWNRLTVKRNTKIEVLVKDLPLTTKKIKILCKCDNCNSIHLVFYGNLKNKSKYLCQKCANQTKEHIQSLKKSLIGLKRSEECKKHIRENNWMRGKIGDKSPVWNFNKTDLERKIKHAISGIGFWKTFIKQKYNYQCQNPKCNHVGKLNDGSIHVHHLNNFHIFKEQRTDIDNGIVLCIKCHKLLHKIYGKYTTNEHFNKFIQEY